MTPAVGRCTPARVWMSVDLPAPFSPNSTWTSPMRRSKSTASSATTPGKCLLRPSARNNSSYWAAEWTAGSVSSGVVNNDKRRPPTRPRSIAVETRLQVLRRQGGGVGERVHVALVDHVDLRPDMLQIRLALEDTHRLVDGDTPLDHRRVRRRRHHPPPLDVLVDAGREVIGDDLDLVGEVALAQQLDRRLGRRRRPGDVLNIGMCLERVLDELHLHFLAGVAVLGVDHLDIAVLDGVEEALVAGFDPARARRPREPGNLHLARAFGMLLRDIIAGVVSHLLERDERLGRDLLGRTAVDHVDHRNVLLAHRLDGFVETIDPDE